MKSRFLSKSAVSSLVAFLASIWTVKFAIASSNFTTFFFAIALFNESDENWSIKRSVRLMALWMGMGGLLSAFPELRICSMLLLATIPLTPYYILLIMVPSVFKSGLSGYT